MHNRLNQGSYKIWATGIVCWLEGGFNAWFKENYGIDPTYDLHSFSSVYVTKLQSSTSSKDLIEVKSIALDRAILVPAMFLHRTNHALMI